MESLIANMPAAASPLDGSRRLVVKIGSALLVDDDSGHIRRSWLDALMDDVAGLRRRGVEVLIVSSGAIALGRRHLGIGHARPKLEEKQAAAATGQRSEERRVGKGCVSTCRSRGSTYP